MRHIHPVTKAYAQHAKKYDTRYRGLLESTYSEARRRLAALPPGTRVLDIAGGTGALADGVPGAAFLVADATPAMTAEARHRRNLPAITAAAEQLPLRHGSMDAIAFLNALHHLDHPAPAFAEIARILRPGGIAVITDFSGDSPLLRALDPWWRRRYPEHARTYRLSEATAEARTAGLHVEAPHDWSATWFWHCWAFTARKPAPTASAAQ